MVDYGAPVAQKFGRMGKKTEESAPFHCGSDGGEMVADVAKSGGAEKRVGNRMQHDVGIAVAGKAAIVRNL